jgi:hypothetical protein
MVLVAKCYFAPVGEFAERSAPQETSQQSRLNGWGAGNAGDGRVKGQRVVRTVCCSP